MHAWGWSDLVGMVGVVCVLLAYGFLQMQRWTTDQVRYSLTNLLGAVLILISLCYHWNWSSVIIELAWISISIAGLSRLLTKHCWPSTVPSSRVVSEDPASFGSRRSLFLGPAKTRKRV